MLVALGGEDEYHEISIQNRCIDTSPNLLISQFLFLVLNKKQVTIVKYKISGGYFCVNTLCMVVALSGGRGVSWDFDTK